MEMRARASGNEKISDLLNKSKSRLKEAIYLVDNLIDFCEHGSQFIFNPRARYFCHDSGDQLQPPPRQP